MDPHLPKHSSYASSAFLPLYCVSFSKVQSSSCKQVQQWGDGKSGGTTLPPQVIVKHLQIIFMSKVFGNVQIWSGRCLQSTTAASLLLLHRRSAVKWAYYQNTTSLLSSNKLFLANYPSTKTSLYFSLPTSPQLRNFTRKWAIRGKKRKSLTSAKAISGRENGSMCCSMIRAASRLYSLLCPSPSPHPARTTSKAHDGEGALKTHLRIKKKSERVWQQ